MTLAEKYRYIDRVLQKAIESNDESVISECLDRLVDCYGHEDDSRFQTPAEQKLEEYLDNAHDKVESHLYTVEENNGNFGFNDGE